MKQLCLLALMLSAGHLATAQNPVIRNAFAADPTARVFDGKVYVYPSHDIHAPAGQRQDWFCMADYHVYSSANLTEWTDHGVILSQEQVPWGNHKGYSMWAPDCVSKDGKYYFYFPNAPKEGRGFAIGVATADSPVGPFVPEAQPIKGVTGIDPCVLVDDDGSSYIYWSGMGIRGARLADDMKTLDGEARQMEGLPEGFKEGPFVFKRNGRYYLTFPWVRQAAPLGGKQEEATETLAYAMSDSPLGPWQFKGIFMAEHDNGCWTNHHSFVEYDGQWLLFYHRNDYSPNMDKRRSVRIEKVNFRADGTISEVTQTMRGVGISRATARIDVDRYSSAAKGVATDYVDSADFFRGWCATLPAKGGWLGYADVDFSDVADGYAVVCVKAPADTRFSLRSKSRKGKVLCSFDVKVYSPERPYYDRTDQWITLSAPLSGNVPSGIADLYVTVEGPAPVSIDWVQFKNRPEYFTAVDDRAEQTAKPDEQGFIRRWNIMEPLAVDVRSNVIFTDTWLRKTFADRQAELYKKNNKWHAIDSQTFNVRLFRFAEKFGQQTYGSLFWCETVVDCPADFEDIRLSCGTNGASMWWIDDREVLLLSGDRRMVEDDGQSGRLTLTKGRHVLRCAVINGPGLSDMCVRFVDSKGKPLTNLKIEKVKK